MIQPSPWTPADLASAQRFSLTMVGRHFLVCLAGLAAWAVTLRIFSALVHWMAG